MSNQPSDGLVLVVGDIIEKNYRKANYRYRKNVFGNQQKIINIEKWAPNLSR